MSNWWVCKSFLYEPKKEIDEVMTEAIIHICDYALDLNKNKKKKKEIKNKVMKKEIEFLNSFWWQYASQKTKSEYFPYISNLIIGPSSPVSIYDKTKYINNITLFFDFYAMNDIWFRLVGHHEEYGYKINKILPERKEKAITETFLNTVERFKAIIVKELEYAVRREAGHCHCHCDGHVSNKYSDKWIIYEKTGKEIDLEFISWVFGQKWNDKFYGGPKWKEATDWLIKLKNSKSIKDTVFVIDRIMDLEHNTGFILNKRSLMVLAMKSVKYKYKDKKGFYSTSPLNYRFRASLEELLCLCSKNVKNIYTANKNYLTNNMLELEEKVEKEKISLASKVKKHYISTINKNKNKNKNNKNKETFQFEITTI